jgi:malonate-semialdehyde dehydrogenase (acetylating) / methylmalonate-semialdehyde dehydrogenase
MHLATKTRIIRPLCRCYASASSTLSNLAAQRANSLSKWSGVSYQGGQVSNYISGEFSESKTDKWIQVLDPSTQTPLSKVPETTEEEFNRAVEAASDAFKTWSSTSILTRQRFALEYVI